VPAESAGSSIRRQITLHHSKFSAGGNRKLAGGYSPIGNTFGHFG
jgi:hypothetical protein